MKRPQVPRSEYKKFIKGLSLKELKMVFVSATVEEKFTPPANLKIQDASSYEMLNKDKIKVVHKYHIEGTKRGDDKAGFKVEVHYILLYSSKIPMTKEIFQIFAKSSLRLHTWPYFRQFVHQLTLNMHLPPIVLDTIKIPA